MPAAEARTDLLEKFANLAVVRRNGEVWRTTTAGSPWVMLGWGYKEGSLNYSLHVHGKLNAKNQYVPTAAEPKIRSSDMTQEIHLSDAQFTLVRKTANAAIAAAENS